MKSFLKLNLKEKISISILILINFLFSLKYLSRYTEYSLLISILLSLYYLVLLSNSVKLKLENKRIKQLTYGFTFLFILISIYILKKVEITTLNVDRWSVISSFWDSFFIGDYPYYAKSHMNNNPGPMPFYFLIALPFYLINELGYFSLLGFVLFIYLINKTRIAVNYKLLITIFIITSTFFYWELITRSNIFTNSFLILWFLLSFNKRKNASDHLFFLWAIIAGFLISTRAIFIIPFIIFFMYDLRKKEISIHSLMKFVFISFLSFFATFLPLIIFYPEDFYKMNPFIIQSSFFIPTYYIALFILISFIFSFLSKNRISLYYFSGLSLFISILIYFLYHILLSNFKTAYFESKVDISYFIFCIPFFIIYLVKMKHFNYNSELLSKS